MGKNLSTGQGTQCQFLRVRQAPHTLALPFASDFVLDQRLNLTSYLKTSLRNRLPRAFSLLRRAYRFPYDYWKPKAADISLMLEKLCAEGQSSSALSFIQIGANNGKDEFAALRKKYCWKGIMVEPQQDVFAELTAS